MNRRNLLLSLASFFLPVGVTLIVFALVGIYPFGELTFMRVDMALQYSSFLSSLKEVLSGNNDLFYSFSLNGGGNFFFLNAYYLANPINYLMVLVPLEELPNALSWLILLRIGLCGLTSGLYLRKIGKNNAVSLLFSTSYALMTYNMVNAENYFFVDGVIFLPIVLIGIENIFQKQKITSYVIALSLTLMIQFYIGYMICIFSCIYFLFRWYLENSNHSPKKDWEKMGRFILGSLLAGGIAALVLLPVAKGLAGSPKTSNPDLLTSQPNFQFFDLLSKNVLGAYDGYEYKLGLPGIYCGTLITVLSILFFFNRKISAKEKWLSAGVFGILTVSFYVFGLNALWHGMAEPAWWPYRYSFIFSFWMIRVAWRSLNEISGVQKKHLIICGAISILIILFINSRNYRYLDSEKIGAELTLILILLALLTILTGENMNSPRYKFVQSGIAVCALISLAANSFVIFEINSAESLPVAAYKQHVTRMEAALEKQTQLDSGFYRAENLVMRNQNDPVMFDYYGLSHYSSTTSQYAMKSLSNLGVQQLWYWTLYTEGVPIATDSLMGIKYLIHTRESTEKPYLPVDISSELITSENPYALPLGFVVPQKIIRQVTYRNDPFDYLNQIYRNLSESEFGNIYTEVDYSKKKLPDGSHVWEIDVDTTDALYSYRFDALDRQDTIQLNGHSVSVKPEEYYYGSYRLGNFSIGDKLTITAQPGEDVPEDLQRLFYSEDLTILEKYAEAAQARSINLEKNSSSFLKGSYTTQNETDYVFLSIPFSEGWRCQIDGTERMLIPLGNGMMAVSLLPGTHQMTLRYTPPGFKTGATISAISLLIFILLSVFRKKKTIRITDKGFENSGD